ncbi:hypothetical protein POM88_051564 [Heracleum sosnowskyi]|uniref:Uncharacterized protein n=1 Tax=Heracleum sosnowskyi TaxID=360622 RepID=A0AAD8M3U1_9APIA|nr:hypothetical protein POM88_051564 [Heracleum sosnowskyi]
MIDEVRGHFDIALAKIDEAIKYTPTLIDIYSTKSRILTHGVDMEAAAALADEDRCMDLADCYANSYCVKCMLQADQVTLAGKSSCIVHKRRGSAQQPHDMQYMWYELKENDSIEKLKFQDRLRSHKYFRKAAAGAISSKCYLNLYDSPPKRKKIRRKNRKADAQAKKETEVRSEESNVNGSEVGKRHLKPVDADTHGEKMLQHKILLALQALNHLLRLDAESPDSHRCMIRFFYKAVSIPSQVTESEKLTKNLNFAANTLFLGRHNDSLMHRAAAAEMLHLLEPKRKAEAIKLIEESSNNPVSKSGSHVVKEWKLKD